MPDAMTGLARLVQVGKYHPARNLNEFGRISPEPSRHIVMPFAARNADNVGIA
jgi:hypothetical protein